MAKSDPCAEFVLTMLHSVTNAHILHLQTRLYSAHKALQKYYEDIGDIVDSFIECYQGRYDRIETYTEQFALAKDAEPYMKSLLKYVDAKRKELPQDSELQNIVDEMVALIDQTLYRLDFLE